MPEKRKRPPTFQHHPANRAKQLKTQWVQNAKLKSKWKAEKRKREEDKAAQDASEGDEREEETPRPPSFKKPKPAEPPIQKHEAQRPEPQQRSEPLQAPSPSLRDRAREAYSRSSLHTYKSDPSGKQRQRGGGTTGRGQPDMKKRMNVLLETIKRDYS